MESSDKFERMAQIARAFSPSAPIGSQVFAGRAAQINDVINACTQRGQHVVIFGERGAGKTSLANVLVHILGAKFATPACGAINCDQTTTFASLWKAIFSEIPIAKNTSSMGGRNSSVAEEGTLAQFLPDEVTPDAVRSILQKRNRLLIIIDEIDRIKDKATTTLLADTIKNLSDHSVDATLVLVGVAESVDTLIAEHESVQRALVQVPLPRMSNAELEAIIDNGLAAVAMTIEPAAKQRIVKLSQGLPHYTHLLALHSAQTASGEGRSNIMIADSHHGLQRTLRQLQQSIASDYHRATLSAKSTHYRHVLLACALADTDAHGCFTAGDVSTPMSLIMGKTREVRSFAKHLNAFCEHARGPALQRMGVAREYKYKFKNPILRPYVILNGLETGLISEAAMTQLVSPAPVAPADASQQVPPVSSEAANA
jgi:Cdc6-like AAA superfamily ATPase